MHNDASSTMQKLIIDNADSRTWKVLPGEPNVEANGIRRNENSSHEDSANHTDDYEFYDRSKDTQHREDIIIKN